jgi:hypothetical protein
VTTPTSGQSNLFGAVFVRPKKRREGKNIAVSFYDFNIRLSAKSERKTADTWNNKSVWNCVFYIGQLSFLKKGSSDLCKSFILTVKVTFITVLAGPKNRREGKNIAVSFYDFNIRLSATSKKKTEDT